MQTNCKPEKKKKERKKNSSTHKLLLLLHTSFLIAPGLPDISNTTPYLQRALRCGPFHSSGSCFFSYLIVPANLSICRPMERLQWRASSPRKPTKVIPNCAPLPPVPFTCPSHWLLQGTRHANPGNHVPPEIRLEKNEARKEAQREERRLKRLAKQEAKRERKAAQPSRPKSVAVLKSEQKKKERTVRPDKTQRTKAKLLSRSKKLEVQAAKMMADAKKAYAKYQSLLEVSTFSLGSHPGSQNCC